MISFKNFPMITPTNSFKKHVSCCLWLAARLLKIDCIIPLKYFQTYFFTSTNCFQNCQSCWLLSAARLLKKFVLYLSIIFKPISSPLYLKLFAYNKTYKLFSKSESCYLWLAARLLKIVCIKPLKHFKLVSSPIYFTTFFL